MSLFEILLVPLYILIFYLFFKIRSKRIEDPALQKYYLQGFRLKMLASILFVLYYTYLTGGDTRSLYYAEGHNLYRLLLNDSAYWKYIFRKGTEFDTNLVAHEYSIGYLREESNFITIKVTALLSFLSFGYYTIISLFFACFAYSGLWRLFLFFYEQRPEMHKAFALSVLFFPSMIFWSSGIMKDSLCIAALGYFTYSLYHLFQGKKPLTNIVSTIIAGSLLFTVKKYILLAYLPLYILFILAHKLQKVRVPLAKYLLFILIVGSMVFTFVSTYDSYSDELDAYAIENLTSSIETLNHVISIRTVEQGAASNFNLGAEFDGTFSGLIKIAPYAIIATFFRPFIWETTKISQLMAAIESLILIFFTIKIILKTGPIRSFRYTISDPLILFCLSFALVFALFVGASTLNFGTLVRYKIPSMPFYCAFLFLLNNKASKKLTSKVVRTFEETIILPA